jgi:MFS family permease
MTTRYRLSHYLLGATAARTGDEMSAPALLLLGLAATGSPAVGSALIAGLTISCGVGGPILGAVLDRSPAPGRLLAMALALYGCGLGVVMALVGAAPTGLVVAVAVLAGTAAPAFTGGWTAQLPRIVAGGDVQRGLSLDAATYGAASLAGPALAGLAAAVLGARWAVAVAVALLVAAVPIAARLPCAGPDRARPPDAGGLHRDLARGVRAIVQRRALLAATVATMLSSAGFAAFVVASPLVGERLAGSAAAGTTLLSVLAVGSLLGAGLLARRPWRGAPEGLLLATTALLGGAFAALAAAGSFAVAIGAAFVAGVANGPQVAAVFQIRHREAPEELRTQLFTTAASVKMSAFALGSAAAGALVTRSATLGLLAAAIAQLLAIAAVLALGGPTARARRRPEARTARA